MNSDAPAPRVVVHDFSGHPFQAELSRGLAGRGFDVEHLSAHQYVSGKGHLERQPDDAPSLSFAEIDLEQPFEKYSPVSRLRWERSYGKAWVARLKARQPTAVVACNVPLIALWIFSRHARRARLPWVMWHQDIYSMAMADELARRLPRPVARVGRRLLLGLEARIIRQAAHVVAIGDAFTEVYDDWKIDTANKVSVIPNWAPLDKIFPVERENRRASDLFPDAAAVRLVYAGTLGRKHNPDLLPQLIEGLRERGIDASMTVVSQGDGADAVAKSPAARRGLVRVVGFQPAADLPDVLGSADVLVSLLEPDATRFSIPSKVLSYMAAGRPIIGLMPADNPAAIDIQAAGGHVATPDVIGVASCVEWVAELAKDPARVIEIGKQTRARAEQVFDVETVTTRFAEILTKA